MTGTSSKQKLIWIVEHHEWKGFYPFERAAVMGQTLKEEVELFLYVKGAPQYLLETFTEHGLRPILFDHYDEVLTSIRPLQPQCIVIDSFDIPMDKLERFKSFCETVITLDDLSDNAQMATFNFKMLFEEIKEFQFSNEVNGTYFFITPNTLKVIKENRLSRQHAIGSPPHICIYFEDGDKQNLTYRTLRHFIQLHIPLKITVLLDENYLHSAEELQLMALSRKNIQVVKHELLSETLSTADCLVCNSLYTPFKAAYIGIPCITAAQHERELSLAFPTEQNGFSNIGLGRKMKQSHLQNALMELLLHDSRRERAIKLQQKHQLHLNNELFHKLLIDIANKHDPFPSII